MNEGVFAHPIRLYYRDFDRYGKIKVSSILSMMSDVAGIHYTSRGYSYEWMKEQNQVFLLSAVRFQMLETVKQDQTVTVRTWEGNQKGAAFIRYFEILDEAGTTLVRAASNWMLVNPVSRKLIRPKDFVGEIMPAGMEDEELQPQRIKLQTETLQYTTHSDSEVRFTDIDQNDHLYNAVYADKIYDALPDEYLDRRLLDFQIHFRNEAHLGNRLCIGFEEKEDGLTVIGQTADDEKVCFSAKLIFASDDTR